MKPVEYGPPLGVDITLMHVLTSSHMEEINCIYLIFFHHKGSTMEAELTGQTSRDYGYHNFTLVVII